MRYYVSFFLLFAFYANKTFGLNYTADQIFPQIGQRGTQCEIILLGTDLQGLEEVLFYRKGIKCNSFSQILEIPHESTGKPHKVEAGRAQKLIFEISEDAPLGEYFLRIRTKSHLSELLSFWVTPFPVVFEEHAYWDMEDNNRNDTLKTAQKVDLPVTVVGYHPSGSREQMANDIDSYLVDLKNGQIFTAQVLNSRLGHHHYGGLTDMYIEIKDPNGQRLARCDDSPLLVQDPVISITAKMSGTYQVIVRQQMDSEQPRRHYGLHMGAFKRPSILFPLGGMSGENLPLEIAYLDGTSEMIKVKLPTEIGPYENSLLEITSLHDFGMAIPTPNLLRVASFPNVYEEQQSTKQNPQVVNDPLPLSLNGEITKDGQRDYYRVTAKEGERYRVRVYGMTLGSKIDSFVKILPAEGNPSTRVYEEDDSLWDGHDWEGHHYRHQVKDRLDPVFMFEPDKDGDYIVIVSDTRRESGPDFVYRLEFEPHKEQMFCYYKDYPSQSDIVRDRISIHAGSSVSRPIALQKGLGTRFSGAMKWEAVGLPDGVTFECPEFMASDPEVLVLFHNHKKMERQSGLIELKPISLEEEVHLDGAVAQTSASTGARGGFSTVFNRTRKLAWAILEEAPFSIALEQPGIGLAKNAELDLKINLTRKHGFTGAVYLEMDWLPVGVTKQPPLIIEEGQNHGFYRLSATTQAKTGKFKVSITGRENEGGNPRTATGFHYVASPGIEVEVVEPYLSLELARVAIEQGKKAVMSAKVKHHRPFEGVAKINLRRLPFGLEQVDEVLLESNDVEISLPLIASADCLTGQYKDIFCEITIRDRGQKILQQTGNGTVRVDEKRN